MGEKDERKNESLQGSISVVISAECNDIWRRICDDTYAEKTICAGTGMA